MANVFLPGQKTYSHVCSAFIYARSDLKLCRPLSQALKQALHGICGWKGLHIRARGIDFGLSVLRAHGILEASGGRETGSVFPRARGYHLEDFVCFS